MFTTKKSSLFDVPTKKTTSSSNSFVTAAKKNTAETRSGNNAKKYSTTDSPFVDQFSFLGSYKEPRSFDVIAADCEQLWSINTALTVVFMFYIRMIVRIVQLFDGSKTSKPQKGAELKHEGIMRMIWLHMKAPEIFKKNIGLFVSIGSWKDIITMMRYDLIYNGWDNKKLDWVFMGNLIISALDNENTRALVKKYLPQIRAKSKCTTVESQANTMIGKYLAYCLFKNQKSEVTRYKLYRKFKSLGTAHEWQKHISRKDFDRIDFNTIHGRALNLLVRGKFLDSQGLRQKYEEWISSNETTDVKYTGFVHELLQECTKYDSRVIMPNHVAETINKQFDTLVQKGGESEQTSLIVVRDTSGSMSQTATGTTMSCGNIAKSLALYFSEFLKGKFQNSWIEFHSDARMHEWRGNTVTEKWFNDTTGYIGNTDFQTVVKLFCKIKTHDNVPEEEFPTGMLCISDGEFDPSYLDETNVETTKVRLRNAGFSKEYVDNFVIVLWNLQSSYYGRDTGKKFETYGTDVPNVFYFSGYSAATISFLTNKIKNVEELFHEAMSQEILTMIEV